MRLPLFLLLSNRRRSVSLLPARRVSRGPDGPGDGAVSLGS